MVSRRRSAVASRRRRRRVAALDHDLSDTQWQDLLAAWGGCAYCGAVDPALQRDTMVPISRGGRYTLTNVVPACRSCNASKCNTELTTWMRRKKYDEPEFLLRQYRIAQALQPAAADGPGPPPPA